MVLVGRADDEEGWKQKILCGLSGPERRHRHRRLPAVQKWRHLRRAQWSSVVLNPGFEVRILSGSDGAGSYGEDGLFPWS